MLSKTRSLLAGLGLSAAALTVMLDRATTDASAPPCPRLSKMARRFGAVSDAVRVSHVGAGPVVTLSDRMALVLAGRVDLILRLARCPMIQNGY